MEFDTLILLLAGGWALLNWVIRSARGGSREAEQPEAPDPAELEARRQRTLERMQARRRERQAARGASRTEPAQVLDPAERFRREMERIMGVHTEEEHGPLGRRGGVQLEPAEEVEELEPLEVGEQVISLEVPDTRPLRVLIDQDAQAEEIVRRRIAVAEAHNRPKTRADHAKFDQTMRSAPAEVTRTPKVPRLPGKGLRQALIWLEILGPPVSRR
jgi:hypothetical protein